MRWGCLRCLGLDGHDSCYFMLCQMFPNCSKDFFRTHRSGDKLLAINRHFCEGKDVMGSDDCP